MNTKFSQLNFFLMVSTLLIVGCSDRIYEQPTDQYPFQIKMREVVGNDVEIIKSLSRAEVQLIYLELPLKSEKTQKIVELLKKDGWIYKGAGVGSETYCLGLNNSINIVSPISSTVTNYKGGDLYMTDYNSDIVSYSYNKWGLDICE
ncbi:hypothetical protein [Acinetobacter haemolyticus]|uniref:Lipoprotein n=1 Tax=Acinetobacter haemolyticus TaxID=29430 RepID=A0AAW4JDW9_ACIHA|nr:hypothetical protein [Acinetobacter haemolyticus]MBO3658123.1 hypothetical protein [Acinetobacter haemolyticus]MCU4379955.1 hypothetical protein [Acinetobacter haemolyticus]MCU4387113.1 hypothetical protein [Acinetobacter haemolyticus]